MPTMQSQNACNVDMAPKPIYLGEFEYGVLLAILQIPAAYAVPVRAFLETEHAPDGFYLNIHDRPGPYMVGPQTMRLGGRSHVRETVAGISFLVSPTAFFQTNVEAAERLVGLVLDATPAQANPVLDLYAGSGLFSLPLAHRGHMVTAVEENAVAVRDAEVNMRLNRLPPQRVRLLATSVETALTRLRREAFDQVVLDPPRSGCPPKVLHALFGRQRPARVLYVSCNPEALANELPAILQHGYRISRVQPVDMFPHTTHIETFVLLDRPAARDSRH